MKNADMPAISTGAQAVSAESGKLGYTLPCLPGPAIAKKYGPQVEAYGHACAEAARAPLLARVAELKAENQTLTRECADAEDESGRLEEELQKEQDENDRLRAELERLRAKIDRAGVSYGNMLRADDKRIGGTTEYTRGWGNCLRAIADRKGEGSEG